MKVFKERVENETNIEVLQKELEILERISKDCWYRKRIEEITTKITTIQKRIADILINKFNNYDRQ